MKYLGIDGGGTKTEFVIIDDNGSIMSHSILRGCHYKQTGFEGFRNILENGIKSVCSEANITLSQIKYSFAGIPGYGEIKPDAVILDHIITEIFQGTSYRCGNDAEAGWAGSLACSPGINIVAGTGTIAIGIDGKGKIARSGGWGHFCGDEGSAYWLGKKAIGLFTKESDNRINKSPLYDILKQELKISRDYDIISLMVDDYKMDRDKIASFAVYLYMAAEQNDPNAIGIFCEAAGELALMTESVIKQLEFDDGSKILLSYSGGVFKAGEFILDPLKERIKNIFPEIEMIKPILKPVTGAALYAMILDKGTINRDIIANLAEHELVL